MHPFPATFFFLANPALLPEVGKTLEMGVNLKFDNVITANDRLRAKINLFQNRVDDYIDLVFVPFAGPFGQCPIPPFCFQYQNIARARIEGVEFEGMYDAGAWFLGLTAATINGTDEATGVPLLTIPANQFTATLGARFLDRKLQLAVRWAAVDSKTDVPPGGFPTSAYDIVHLYAGYQINPDTLAALAVENLFDKYYFSYLDAQTSRLPGRGLTVKGSLKIRFSDKTLGG